LSQCEVRVTLVETIGTVESGTSSRHQVIKARTPDLGTVESVRAFGIPPVDPCQNRAGKTSTYELRATEVRIGKVGVKQIGVNQVCSLENGGSQVGASQISAPKTGGREFGSRKVGTC
jgi:hypothetical protein